MHKFKPKLTVYSVVKRLIVACYLKPVKTVGNFSGNSIIIYKLIVAVLNTPLTDIIKKIIIQNNC